MWFVYLDESKEDNRFYVYSALIVDAANWADAFSALKNIRQIMKAHGGIYVRQELHAWKFASGKGQISTRPIYRKERAQIFKWFLQSVAETGMFRIISSVNTDELYAFERIINRINRTALAQGHALILICDEGQEVQFTKRIRKMRVHNLIPSRLGTWRDTGQPTRNITIDRFLEDPFFKDSASSFFVQCVDFCAYALLRMERPIPSRSALGYDKMYSVLEPIVFKECNQNDPRGLGIIR
jgi:uncharacterized protein DUF3800